MVDAILKDYNGIPSCCLYMQGIQFEKSTNPHMKRTSLPSEQVVAHRMLETSQTSCSVKKSCKSKYQIKAHYINRRVIYERAGLYFLNFVYAIDFVKRKQNRRVNFSVEGSISFKKNEPPNRVNRAVRKSRIRSKSIAQV
uniref:Transposase n=1 Tax=Strongyloides papillosus TaxID=174720 RepID=A0A0N5BL69_STREA